MPNVRLVTDSAADLDPDVAKRLQISVVPMTVHFGQETFSHAAISIEEFWHRVERGTAPGTSQPAVGLFENVFSELVAAEHQVVCVTITSEHSGTFSTAQSAARTFAGKVHVLDSLSLSLGQGFQVMAAAQAALKGLGVEQVIAKAQEIRTHTQLLILLDTVEHIRRGGRVDHLIPLLDRVTKLLNIKPILGLTDGGRLRVDKLVRSYQRGIQHIRQEFAKLGPIEQLAVVHTRCREQAESLSKTLSEILAFPLDDILIAETGPVLSVHGGPGVMGVAAVHRMPAGGK
jgi:DegV family protein with EDD domain